jgi:hypothetical protein
MNLRGIRRFTKFVNAERELLAGALGRQLASLEVVLVDFERLDFRFQGR